jgi:hypothetical protein
MKKQAITLIFILLMILPSVVAHAQSETPLPTKDDNTITLVLGTMLNVKETNESISGQALYLFYYESELWFKRGGIIKGLKEISFQKTPLFLLYQPGPFGQISYVYGFVRNFSINE